MAKSGAAGDKHPLGTLEGDPRAVRVDQFMADLHSAEAKGTTFVGMVKPDPADKNSVMLSHVGDCSVWMSIHRDALADAQMLHIVPCGDHEHQVARLTLKSPEGPVQEALSRLVVLHKAQVQKVRLSAPRIATAVPAGGTAGLADCPNGTWVDRYGQTHCV